MAPAEQRHAKGGAAAYECTDHHSSQTISWGPGYPPFEPPICAGPPPHPMALSWGDNPQDSLEDVPPPEPKPAEPPHGG